MIKLTRSYTAKELKQARKKVCDKKGLWQIMVRQGTSLVCEHRYELTDEIDLDDLTADNDKVVFVCMFCGKRRKEKLEVVFVLKEGNMRNKADTN